MGFEIAGLCKAKIGQLDVKRVAGLDENVLWLEISMGNGLMRAVKVGQGGEALAQNMATLVERVRISLKKSSNLMTTLQVTLSLKKKKEARYTAPPTHQLHDQVLASAGSADFFQSRRILASMAWPLEDASLAARLHRIWTASASASSSFCSSRQARSSRPCSAAASRAVRSPWTAAGALMSAPALD